MKALTVQPMTAGSARLDDVDEPPLSDGPVLVETLAVGVCGTDIEITSGTYGWAPPGRDRLVLGHESLGRVLEAPADAPVAAGDLVVGIVRRPDSVPCANCAVGEWDFCRNGQYTERGIKQRRRVLLGALPDRVRLRGEARPRPRCAAVCSSSRPAWWPRHGSRWTASEDAPIGRRRAP